MSVRKGSCGSTPRVGRKGDPKPVRRNQGRGQGGRGMGRGTSQSGNSRKQGW